KLGAVPAETLAAALEQARAGRLHILGEMDKALAAPRPDLKPGAPRVSSLRIRRERIRDLIGSGGKTIQEIQQSAGVKIDVDDTGLVRIYAPTAAATAEALRRVRLATLEARADGRGQAADRRGRDAPDRQGAGRVEPR
ncbi:MAG: KH domain-containing protein, partial [Acidobacteria bacterium]|nr:KH domain-containing protein [Acidobacteriota bacterium]